MTISPAVLLALVLALLQGCGLHHERRQFWNEVAVADKCDPFGDCNIGKKPKGEMQ